MTGLPWDPGRRTWRPRRRAWGGKKKGRRARPGAGGSRAADGGCVLRRGGGESEWAAASDGTGERTRWLNGAEGRGEARHGWRQSYAVVVDAGEGKEKRENSAGWKESNDGGDGGHDGARREGGSYG